MTPSSGPLPAQARLSTHEVTNQPEPPGDRDLWAEDAILRHHAAAAGADSAVVSDYARRIGTLEMREAGRAANRHPPELRQFDAGGRRLDEVVFHPAWHSLLATGLSSGYAACPWDTGPGGHATHAAMVYLTSQVEPGVCCPMTMTYAAVPALAADPTLAALWRPRLAARAYDPAIRPVSGKSAATMGMAMTEKQGGSDVRANATRAVPDGGDWRLSGHKWFCSAPMSDGFLTLAQAPGGLTCFLVPRWLPVDRGGRNAIRLLRLKDKLGNRANASAEIEFDGALAHRLGDEGDGIRTILEMVHHTRLDTAMAPAGLMRAALAEALHWARGRSVFQRRLIDQPLMRAVLADLALEVEGATAAAFRIARAFDDPAERPLARIAVALAKFLANKRAPVIVAEAMEALGGMGYVEDTALPMLYREAPLNGIWEGSGNVIALDILRTRRRDPEAVAMLDAVLDAPRGQSRVYDAALAAHRSRFHAGVPEALARLYAEQAATLLSAAVLLSAGSPLAGAYADARLAPGRGAVPGAAELPVDTILARVD